MVDADALVDTVLDIVEQSGYGTDDVQFIFLYGSHADGTATADSDIDIAVSLDVENPDEADIRLAGRAPDDMDIAVFDVLPVHVQKEVLAGDLLYRRGKAVYDAAFDTLDAYRTFHPLYKEAIGAA